MPARGPSDVEGEAVADEVLESPEDEAAEAPAYASEMSAA